MLNSIIFERANDLISSSYIIENEISKVFSSGKDIDKKVGMVHSIIILRSFAIELYLKCLVIIDDDIITDYKEIKKGKLNEHNYLNLFNMIDEKCRSIIISCYNSIDPQITDGDSFRRKVSEIGPDVFIAWRYIYEKSGVQVINMNDLNNFAKTLFNSIVLIKKIDICK
jgi:hypothetical protein